MLAFLMFAFASCSNKDTLKELERIKATGDDNPQKAIAMLDSLEFEIRESNEYTKAKYDLLRIRLNDKAENMPTSDIVIKRLVDYFENEGSTAEKQEAAYYAGSVYRDLQDTPRSLEYFLMSIEYAKTGSDCDSIMMRNAYSNLNDLYYNVQNYDDAIKMAQKELELSKQMKKSTILPYLHIGTGYLSQKKYKQACEAFDSAFVGVVSRKDFPESQTTLLYLLNDYSILKQLGKARKCFSLIQIDPLKEHSGFPAMAFAQYYNSLGKNDSAAIYCKHVIEDSTDIYNMYDAAKLLYLVYNEQGDEKNAYHYAKVYMQLSDSLDFGKRQELAATVNNEYQYHLDQKKEQSLKSERDKYKNTLVIISLAVVLLLSVGYTIHVRRKNKHLREMIALSMELQRMSDDDKRLRTDIEKKEEELVQSQKNLEKSVGELASVKRELQNVNLELSEYDETLKAKERQLAEKMDQNKTFIKLLHQSELEGKAEDVIYAIRQTSTGKKDMKAADWKQLYQAVDELYPTFKDQLLKELGTFTEQQMQVCYLMRIGLSKPQIQNMTNLSRVTVWRWVKKYDWVLLSDDTL